MYADKHGHHSKAGSAGGNHIGMARYVLAGKTAIRLAGFPVVAEVCKLQHIKQLLVGHLASAGFCRLGKPALRAVITHGGNLVLRLSTDFSDKIGISVRPSFLYRHGLPVSAIQGTVYLEILYTVFLLAAPAQVDMPFETESLSDDGSILSHRSVGSLLSKYLDIIDISCMLNVVATVVLVQFYCLDQSRIEGLADSGRVLRLAERAAGDQLG